MKESYFRHDWEK